MTDGRRRWICESGQRSETNVRSWSVAALALSSMLVACAPMQKNVDAVRVRELERNLHRQRQIIETLKERNWVLEKRVKATDPLSSVQLSTSKPVAKSAPVVVHSTEVAGKPARTASAAAPRLPTVLPAKAAPKAASNAVTKAESKSDRDAAAEMPTGEHLLYSKVLETYRSKNLAEMEKTIQLMVKTYPQSVFADNSFYMAGLLAGELGLLPRAHQLLDRVVRDYPQGNKVVSAIFAKSIFLRREAKWDEARRHLKEVALRFPGSPEALRVSMEIKLLELEKKRHSSVPGNGQGA